MSENLSGTYSTLQTLSAGTPRVSVSGTINAYGTAGQYTALINNTLVTFEAEAALFGPASGAFTITNTGIIETHGTAPANLADVGILLGAAGTVRNNGTILGGSGVIVFQTTGAAYVENSRLIEGSLGAGVVIFGNSSASGTVDNSGTIIGSPSYDRGAIEIFGDGFISNDAGGTLIAEASYGIGGQEGAVTVTNAGAIAGLFGGVNLQGGGFVTNAGYIHATGTGATLSNSSYAGINADLGGVVFNSGTILGQNGVGIHYGNGTITSAVQGYVHNSGLIEAFSTNALQNTNAGDFGVGIELQMPGTVVNAGSITASNAGIYTQNGLADVHNMQNGMITSQIGIDLSANSNNGTPLSNVGYVENSGTVQAYSSTNINGNSTNGFPKIGVGVYFAAAGTVVNHGSIAGNHVGIVIENNPGTVTNTGTITSSRGYGVYLNTGGTVSNTGAIIGYQQGIFIGSPGPSQATVTSIRSISNDGFVAATQLPITETISGTTFTAIGAAIDVTGSGTIDNQANGRIDASSGEGIFLYAAQENFVANQVSPADGAIINAGTVDAQYGVYFFGIGSLTNSGTIIGKNYGINLANAAASGSNSGLIDATAGSYTLAGTTTSGVGTAVVIKGGGGFTNTSIGTLAAAAGYGVDLASGGSLTNAGTVNGYIAGVVLKNGGSVGNSGTIAGTGTQANAILAFNAPVNLENSGFISGTGTFSAIYLQDSGTVINYGTIQGQSSTPVYAGQSLAGTLINYGLIRTTGTAASGIYWVAGGTVTNNSRAVISGFSHGVYIRGASLAAVTNSGTIKGTGTSGVGAGLYSSAANHVTNSGTGVIAGVNTGVFITNANGTIQNDGTVIGSDLYGVYLAAGGTVTNAGSIIAYRDGIRARNTRATIINSGIINASGSTFALGGTGSDGGLPPGTYFSHGVVIGIGRVTNTSSGTIIGQTGIAVSGTNSGGYILNTGHVTATGHAGLYVKSAGTIVNSGSVAAYRVALQLNNGGAIINTGQATGKTGVEIGSLASATVVNSGTITGTGGVAIDFANINGPSILRDDPGAVFNGTVENANGLGFLELEYGAIAGTLHGFGTLFTGFSFFEVAGGAIWDIAGATSINAAITLLNDGTLAETGADALTIGGALTGNGALGLAAATVTLDGSVAAGQHISFDETGGRLVLGDLNQFNGSLYGFSAGDTIELAGIAFTGTGGAYGTAGEDTYTVATAGTLSIDADGTIYNLQIANAAVGEADFVLSNDLAITKTACYAAGTRIATAVGEIKVEDLAIGDFLETLNGGLQKIKWIGRRGYAGRFIAGNKDILPIRIAKDAIAEHIPARDLFVSPGHAICIDGALIHAFRLVNGVSITQADSVENITYYHIETENHEIIFAENCPAETFLDETFRAQFQNAAEYTSLYPSQTAPGSSCLPLLEDGFALHAIQQRLAARAGIPLPPPATHGALRGYVDQPGPAICAGWAQDIENPESPVCLDILAGGARIARGLANLYRADLRQAGIGSGCHAFRISLPAGLTGQLEIRRASDGAPLPWTQAALIQAA